MATSERGPIQTYQVTWRSGYVEEVQAHQVLWPPSIGFGLSPTERDRDERVMFHGELDGVWRLILVADAADVLAVRLLVDRRIEARD